MNKVEIELTHEQVEEVVRQEFTNLLDEDWFPPDVAKAMRVVLAWYSPPQGEE